MESSKPIANPWTTRILAALQKSVAAVLEVGRLLTQAKNDLPHGEFQLMVERELPFSPRQAQIYMRVAASPRLANAKHASLLPPAVNTLDLLARLSDHEFARRLQNGDVHPNMSRQDAHVMVKGEQASLFNEAELFLSGIGRQLERTIEQDEFAPHWLKLDGVSTEIIEEIISAMRKLKRRANRIDEKGGPEAFQTEFGKMEKRVAELADEYRRLRLILQKLLSSAEASLQHVPED